MPGAASLVFAGSMGDVPPPFLVTPSAPKIVRDARCSMSSRYVIYIDESGDHSLENVNGQYPIFVLSACIFEKARYSPQIVPAFLDIKFKYWSHDMVVFHSRDIRKAFGDFRILQNPTTRKAFLGDLAFAMREAEFVIVASIINKHDLKARHSHPDNPYDIALTFCLERSYGFLKDQGQQDQRTTVIVEKRGLKEDKDLELSFLRAARGANQWGCALPFDIVFADKKANSTGLQLADLVSFPIGRNYLDPGQPNQAYAAVETKLRRSRSGQADGYGRKVFPF